MSLKIFLLYLAAWSLAAMAPGPAVICSVAQSTRHGFRSSLAGISGIQFGNILFFVGLALGLGTLLATATGAFTVLRVLGALYLFYLGVRLIIFSFQSHSAKVGQPIRSVTTHHSLFLQGLLIQITNPKALFFVSALLPQFIDPHRSLPLQLAILMLTTVAVDTVVLSAYAFFARNGIQMFQTSHASQGSVWLERMFGVALVIFGFGLILSRK